MPDSIVNLLECDALIFDVQDLNLCKFRIDLSIEVLGDLLIGSFGRPFGGDDFVAGFAVSRQETTTHVHPARLIVQRVVVSMNKEISLSGSKVPSIDEAVIFGAEGEELRIYGALDDYEVPCLKMVLNKTSQR